MILFTLHRQQFLRWKKTLTNEHKKFENEIKRYIKLCGNIYYLHVDMNNMMKTKRNLQFSVYFVN